MGVTTLTLFDDSFTIFLALAAFTEPPLPFIFFFCEKLTVGGFNHYTKK